MKDVTPKAHRCTIGGCPAILEVTPQDLRCDIVASCPALYERHDGHIVIGKVMKEIPEEVAKRIGPDEFAVWVPRGLVKPGDDNGRGPIPEAIAPAEEIQGLANETSGRSHQ